MIIKRIAQLFFFFVVVGGTLPISTLAVEENTAELMLKQMSSYIGSQKTIELSFDSSIEVITPQLEKIQFTNSGSARLQRPNKMHTHRYGSYADVNMYFDGSTVSIYGSHVNKYAQFDAPGSVDDLLHALREGHGVSLPGSDLLLNDSYSLLIADVIEAKYIGQGVINGIACEHLAFRNTDTDWQVWIQAGDTPIPRKFVVTSKTMASGPQYTVVIKKWKTGGELKPDIFIFTPPKGAGKIANDNLVEFDELPPEAIGDEKK